MKLGKFNEAADLLTRAIANVPIDNVILGGGIRAFRTLYPEYEALPDEILAEVIRRRYYPQFSKNWDAEFISGRGYSKEKKVSSTVLPDLFAMRGDAYMKAGRRAEALADYRRVKSDAWSGEEKNWPRHLYFDPQGARNFDLPQPWPPLPPKI
jgi:tetratricopeptide (TPR) repeat protein